MYRMGEYRIWRKNKNMHVKITECVYKLKQTDVQIIWLQSGSNILGLIDAHVDEAVDIQ